MPIIEEWTAWFLVRERERELRRQEQQREAERARKAQPAEVVRLPAHTPRRRDRGPSHRRAA